MKITATFLDEISHDIPHQNWGVKEWDRDFAAMKHMGIDKVVMIRCGYNRFLTYPSEVLIREENCFRPPVDLVQMFLDLSAKHGMKFFFGNYCGNYYNHGNPQREIDLNARIGEEVMKRYGSHEAFYGWYLTQEIGRNAPGIIDVFRKIGEAYKSVSDGKPILISPYIEGTKLLNAFSSQISGNPDAISVEDHAREWDEILANVRHVIDIVAFQDGQCDYSELSEFLHANKELTDRHHLTCWTNCESFDRDMPIKFLPIKWEKLLLKLDAAAQAGLSDAITFEFSHFMSPNSCYLQAHGLYDRYCEHYGIALRD